MNSSTVSIYDNVNTPVDLPKSGVFNALNELFNVNTDLEVRIFCPLCEKSFNLKFFLFEHLRTFHFNFLTQMCNESLKFKECPFCNSKFYGLHLTAKHVLHHHYKVIKGLFVNKNKFKCAFCNAKLFGENCNRIVRHIEEMHFLDFVEELKKMFLNDPVEEISTPELVNSTTENRNSQEVEWNDICMSVQKHSENTLNLSVKNFNEASKTNCYDFTDLKQQLDNLKNIHSAVQSHFKATSPILNKSILKDPKNPNTVQKSARRVLRFELPLDDDEKENLVSNQTFVNFKQITADECNLLRDENNPGKSFKCSSTICGEPQHYSTPKTMLDKSIKSGRKKDNSYFRKSNFKSEKLMKLPKSKMKVLEKKAAVFEFQCGKCRHLFKENFELVCHVKNNHKKFSLNALQPYYHCAICNARFYKNHYLKKHHNLH